MKTLLTPLILLTLLTAPATSGEWVSLFDGKSLQGWTPKITGYPLGENPGEIFRVKDGVIHVSYDAFEEFEDRFGHLFYQTPYSHYIFRMEYRFFGDQAKGGPDWAYRNSGVMVHGQSPESMGLDQEFPVCVEVQVLGADPGKTRSTGNLCTPGTMVFMNGELNEDHCTDSSSKSFPGDQWVTLEIHVNGNDEIIHYINGEEVLRYQQPHKDDGTMLSAGTISLQAESHGCEFRNIMIKVLE